MKLTTFASDFTSSKVPKSPYGDKTFDFFTNEVDLVEAVELLRNEFCLNRNYGIKNSIRLRRSKIDLQKFLENKLEFVS